ncbi:MAG: D-2-hydroxyacid dehydrogenase [Burkholderiales bacterium]|nr:D-2-hydroxyacid dehydrogenase [Phycisphaerae bacterium]
MEPLAIWTNQKLDPASADLMRRLTAPHRVIEARATSASNLVAGSRDPAALDAEVLHGQPSVEDILESTKVRFIQLSSAGYTRYDRPDLLDNLKSRGIAFCNASSLYSEPCAQHALAMLLSIARAIPQAVREQADAHWNYLSLRGQSFLLHGQKVVIAGYGAIPRRLVELLAPYSLDITAFRRTVRGDETVRTLPISEIDDHLPHANIVFNILPAATSTNRFFDRDRLMKFKPGAIYLNIGRGDTNDQDALAELLKSNHLSRVFLDVTSPEPLPKDHALWTIPTCHITPHTAGGTFDESHRMVEHFASNLGRFARGERLTDQIA